MSAIAGFPYLSISFLSISLEVDMKSNQIICSGVAGAGFQKGNFHN